MGSLCGERPSPLVPLPDLGEGLLGFYELRVLMANGSDQNPRCENSTGNVPAASSW